MLQSIGCKYILNKIIDSILVLYYLFAIFAMQKALL